MRISRIRKFKKSNEITIVLTRKEVIQLSHAIVCKHESGKCHYPEYEVPGIKLVKQLYKEGLVVLWD